jgi:hypothetical protein
MVRHQHPGPDLDTGRSGMVAKKVAVERVIRIAEEGLRASVAALGDMVRQARKDGTSHAGHSAILAPAAHSVN